MSEPGNKDQVLAKLQDFVSTRPEIVFAYLFGSYATGTAGRLSDVDVAIYIDQETNIEDSGYGYKSEIISDLSSLLEVGVDVVILNHASTILKHQVIMNGILIYSRANALRRTFHEQTTRDYLDLKPLLKVQRDYMRKRITDGTFGR